MPLNVIQFSSISCGGEHAIRTAVQQAFEFSRNPTKKLVALAFFRKFEIKSDAVISHVNFNSKHHNKCKVVLKLIHLATISNLFPLDVE